ncbi:hypothetical protein [Clostridium sp. 001]|uniref:hypothetical protein n=1 Tax=Clostridium sp. 001 TaxID=1970093 RepID=UPI000FD87C03|nr:hypothetical protein [Clostridium sp. 001]AZV56850.1 hypothetical protein DMR38_09710 [Clostridium sp. AWRP]QXE20993.1 hypothetical protein B5S50_20255 [Clostridium sp. 001]
MALSASFDTPQSGSVRSINVTGTIPAESQAYAYVTVQVTNTSGTVNRANSAYSSVYVFNNTSSVERVSASANVSIAIVPKIRTTDSIREDQVTIDWVVR